MKSYPMLTNLTLRPKSVEKTVFSDRRNLREQMSKTNLTPEDIDAKQQRSKSRVRVVVTYFAAVFVFLGGLMLILALGFGWMKAGDSNVIAMKEVFMTVLPIATGVITYWFADRAATKRLGEDSRNRDGTPPVRDAGAPLLRDA